MESKQLPAVLVSVFALVAVVALALTFKGFSSSGLAVETTDCPSSLESYVIKGEDPFALVDVLKGKLEADEIGQQHFDEVTALLAKIDWSKDKLVPKDSLAFESLMPSGAFGSCDAVSLSGSHTKSGWTVTVFVHEKN
ncbi:MAG: hypothetical protein H6502_02295 [Candidatus Woesearchaeota archaeon]|nr:MAG: hypothetical protein H6502_02295 [Candidatus Woesearchaeota archaeon]